MDEASGSTLPFPPLRQGPPVDWAELPADLVAAICRRLHDLFDFVYFRAVCKKWRTATSIADLPPQFPWVLDRRQDPEHLHVYSLITGKTHTIRCPKAHGQYLLKISHGYLYCYDPVSTSDRQINFLLNPLTNDEVHFESKRDFHGCMVCMDLDPMGKNSYIAFKRHNDPEMGFYQPHNRVWYYVQLPVIRFNWRSACLNGSYYLIDSDRGNTIVVDIARGSFFSVPPPDNRDVSYPVYLVQSAGKILSIVMREDLSSISSDFNFSCNIYQLDVLDKNCGYRWVEISSIGNQILFLDFDGGISIAACETAGLRGNCIYYIMGRSDELFRYNIEDGQVEKVCSHLDVFSNWFVPHITGSLSVGSH